jgi:eukaryotic-like serine/threonine-protein kinase
MTLLKASSNFLQTWQNVKSSNCLYRAKFLLFKKKKKKAKKMLEVNIGKKRFSVVRKLGKGTCGSVYAAYERSKKSRRRGSVTELASQSRSRSLSLDQITALKVIQDTKKTDHVRAELKALEALGSHANVVSLKASGCDELSNTWVLELEFAAGGDMLSRIERRPFTEDEARPLVHNVLDALAFAHQNGFCHRDIKLESMKEEKKKRKKN